MKSEAARIVICLIIAVSLAGTVICRGATGGGGGGGGGGGPGGNSSGGGRGGLRARLFTRNANATPLKGQNQSKTKETDSAYLIPAGPGKDYFPIYKAQEVTSYYRREGTGMSAWAIIALILGVIGGGTVAWFCYMVGLPLWRDRQRRHSTLINDPMHRPQHEGIPLQETPSTATPSP